MTTRPDQLPWTGVADLAQEERTLVKGVMLYLGSNETRGRLDFYGRLGLFQEEKRQSQKEVMRKDRKEDQWR